MKRFVVMAAALLAMGCAERNSTLSGGGNGTTQVLLTDDPFPYDSIARVDVYIKEISASASLDTTGLTPQNWVVIAQPAKTFNLLDLQQGTTALAGEVDLPAGQYRAIRVVINTGLSHVIRKDGSEASVHWPVPGDLALYAYVENALDVPDEGAKIVIDFDVARTFLADSTGGFWFSPWIRAVSDQATGSIGGTVTGPDIEGNPTPIADAVVIVFHAGAGIAGSIVGTSRSDGHGNYVLGFLPAGQYGVSVQGPPHFAFTGSSVFVDVALGQRATADFMLQRDTTPGGPDSTVTGGGGTPSGPVMGIAIQPANQSVSVGDSVPVMALLKNAKGETLTGRTVTWTVSDSTKLQVFGSFANWAVLRAKAAGTVDIMATSEGKTAAGTVVIH